MKHGLINVAVPGTVRRQFTYKCPEDIIENLSPGQRILVPFGKKRLPAFYIKPASHKPKAELKSIIEFIDLHSLFENTLFKFLTWMSDYYLAPLGDTFNAALPPDLRRIKKPAYVTTDKWQDSIFDIDIPADVMQKIEQKGELAGRDITGVEKKYPGLIEKLIDAGGLKESWVSETVARSDVLLGYKINPEQPPDDEIIHVINSISDKDGLFTRAGLAELGITNYRLKKLLALSVIVPVYGLPDIFNYLKPREDVSNIIPNKEQTQVIDNITSQIDKFIPWLLYGITGSGKTLVYCHVARKVIEQGRTVLVLVPEIALAGTLLSYFKSFFGDKVALLHSALKPKERVLIWQNIKLGRYNIVVGARSAVFAPLEYPGLIIVDEEHDESYKQDDPAPRFQARDAAVMRAKIAGIPVILGSATPSLESYYNAQQGRYSLLKLTHRPEKTALPLIRLIDLKEERFTSENPFFTSIMSSKIKQSLKKNNQVILYLNRRGFAPRIKCGDCGYTPVCPQCQVSLTYHKSGQKLMCHFCGYIERGYDTCSSCGGSNLIYIGTGTQKIEEKIGELFENARLVRLDSDSAAGREKAHRILAAFASREYNMLLGTQMVSKGIDFPDVSLVGVLMADIGLDMPDFRAPEKLFAKLIQVSGRSGRGIIPGEVVIQTYNPNLDLIDDVARQDYDTFYEREIKSRRNLLYPPFAHIVNFRLSAKKEETVQKYSLLFKQSLEKRLNNSKLSALILGPAPSPLYRLRGMYRRHLMVKTKQITGFVKFLDGWDTEEKNFGLPPRVKLIIDVDPFDLM